MTDQAESDRKMIATEEELRDLSLQDAEELRAFQEKRRWFESKLQLLEAVPPIQPFAHPELALDGIYADVADPIYKGVPVGEAGGGDNHRRRLPRREELEHWQAERDALEQEVLDFDDGDLGRMKEKTRAVTQVPLTPPSTHLVEITLDLILLIDRLLSLLRVRYELLELTSLRLTWDDLRWQIHWESAEIASDLSKVLAEHAGWLLARMAGDKDQPFPSDTASLSVAAVRPPHTSPRNGTDSTPTSPSTSRYYRRQSVQVAQLRSTTTSLRIRHTTLQSTSLKKAGEVMDQMIDRAASLKSVAGMKQLDLWPRAEQDGDEAGGAIPDELLDIQDDVENSMAALQKDLGQAKVVEQWMDDAERYFASAIEVGTAATAIIDRLRSAMFDAVSTALAADLHGHLRTTEASLRHLHAPPPLPTAIELQPNTSKNLSEVAKELDSAQRATSDDMAAAQACVEWYSTLAARRADLQKAQRATANLTADLLEAVRAVSNQQEQLQSSLRDETEPAQADSAESPGPMLDIEVKRLEELQGSAKEQLRSTHNSTTEYDKSSTDRPSIVIERIPKPAPDPIRREMEQVNAALGRVIHDSTAALKKAKRYLAVHEQLEAIKEGIESCEEAQGRICGQLVAALDAAKWDSSGNGCADDMSEQAYEKALLAVGNLIETHAQLSSSWSAIHRSDADFEYSWIPAGWGDRVKAINRYAVGVEACKRLLERLHEQALRVREVEVEAEALTKEGGAEEQDRHKRERAQQWADGLAARIAIIEVNMPDIQLAELQDALVGVKASQARLRKHVNELAVRVRTQSQPAHEDEVAKKFDTRMTKVEGAVEQDAIAQINQLQTTIIAATTTDLPDRHARKLRRQIRDLRIPSLVFPSPSDLSLDTRLIPSAPLVQRLSDTLNAVQQQCEDSSIFPLDIRAENHYLSLMDDLAGAKAHLPRLNALATVRAAVKMCDEAFSAAMAVAKAVDVTPTEETMSERKRLADDAINAIRVVTDVSGAVESDGRVKEDLRRVRFKWSEVAQALGVYEGIAVGEREQDVDEDTSDVTSFTSPPASPLSISQRRPLPSMLTLRALRSSDKGGPLPSPSRLSRVHRLRRFPSSTSLSRGNAGTRTTSNPFPDRLTQPTASSRNRTVSDIHHVGTTPNRKRVDSLASSIGRMAVSSAGSRRTPIGDATATSRPRTLLGGSGRQGSPTMSKGPAHGGSVGRKGSYVPNDESQLDVAIGNIVNQLKVDVPIQAVQGRQSCASSRPLASAAGNRHADEWQDESGRYWIGYAERAKLCFCRILKSRTVMVRVGGGWMELSRFLVEHFAQVAWDDPEASLFTEAPSDPQQAGSPPSTHVADNHHDTRPDSSPAPRTAPASATEIPPFPSSPLTPIRPKPYGQLTSMRSASATPLHKTPLSAGPITPLRTPTALDAPGGLVLSGSPGLVPLHFIRKASDSPPVREMEKERFAGRRSILGKGTPTGTPTGREER